MSAHTGNASADVFVVQISDLHIMAPGKRAFDLIDTAANLTRCVRHIASLRPRPAAVIASGDLVDGGSPAEYQRLRELLAPLPVPVHLLPGNHDRRGALRSVFTEHGYYYARDSRRDGAPGGGKLDFTLRLGALDVIGLDTAIENEPHGALDDPQFDWLAAELSSAPERAALIVMHHPPFASGMALMDNIGLASMCARRLEAIVRSHPRIRHVACGHVHRSITTTWAGIPVSIGPSTAFQAALEFDGAAWGPSVDEPPGYQLLRLSSGALSLHTIAVQA